MLDGGCIPRQVEGCDLMGLSVGFFCRSSSGSDRFAPQKREGGQVRMPLTAGGLYIETRV